MAITAVHKRVKTAGFTLIEVMAVVFIMGLMAGVVVLSMPREDTTLKDAARRFAADVKHAADESIVGGRTVGLSVDDRGYAFYLYEAGDWRAADVRRAWPQGVDVTYDDEIEGTPAGRRADEGRPSAPSLRFSPTGEATPFEVIFGRGGAEIRVGADANGDIHMGRL
ncbi:MAG: type II secretion system minor pseudopilin GspH [Pseudomonadota bacterium]